MIREQVGVQVDDEGLAVHTGQGGSAQLGAPVRLGSGCRSRQSQGASEVTCPCLTLMCRCRVEQELQARLQLSWGQQCHSRMSFLHRRTIFLLVGACSYSALTMDSNSSSMMFCSCLASARVWAACWCQRAKETRGLRALGWVGGGGGVGAGRRREKLGREGLWWAVLLSTARGVSTELVNYLETSCIANIIYDSSCPTITPTHFQHYTCTNYYAYHHRAYSLAYSTMKKKNSQLRFHSPAAKITPTSKLPSDFFTPHSPPPTELVRCPSLNRKESAHPIEDAMLLTFRRTNSHSTLPCLTRQPSKHSRPSPGKLPRLAPLNPPDKQNQNSQLRLSKQVKRISRRIFRSGELLVSSAPPQSRPSD